jgi:Co/Zn/Cd efflux system component
MDECCKITHTPAKQRSVLITILSINALMFLVEAVAGLLAYSTALLADSVDMLGDAIVYGFSLYVIGKGIGWKARAAFLKGMIMAALGIGVLIQVTFKILHGIAPTGDGPHRIPSARRQPFLP